MNHENFEELLLLYVAGQLSETERAEIEAHLLLCADCRADLQLWQATSEEIGRANRALSAPPNLVERAIHEIHAPNRLAAAFLRTWQLLRAQAFLVQREMWPAAALVMFIGVGVALIAERASVLYFLAPLMAASTLAMLYGPENDPGLELSLATPISPWKILLARLSLVSGYNLLLCLAASLSMLFIVPPGLLGALILGWLGPLAFLSALALLLSIWLGTSQAITITYSLWLLQYIPFKAMGLWFNSPGLDWTMLAYQQFWHSPLLLLPLSLLLVGLALWSANQSAFRLPGALG